jgi:hypothetical protein
MKKKKLKDWEKLDKLIGTLSSEYFRNIKQTMRNGMVRNY